MLPTTSPRHARRPLHDAVALPPTPDDRSPAPPASMALAHQESVARRKAGLDNAGLVNAGLVSVATVRRILLGLQLFNAVSAVGGGIALAAGVLGVPVVLLRHTPFDSFVVPGIFLAVIIGGSAAIGAAALLNHWTRALAVSAAAGTVMIGWILGETLLVEGFSWLQGLYLLTGSLALVATVGLAWAGTPTSNSRAVAPPHKGGGM